jgi:MFS family permease
VGRVIILARTAYPITWLLVACAPESSLGDAVIFVALGFQGIAAGIENANEMGYWQTLTPDRLLGRVNATRRSINQTMGALGAVLGGLCIGAFGEQFTLATAVAGFAVAAAIAASSALRRHGS